MEPFGLFNFLQALLASGANSAQKSANRTTDESPNAQTNDEAASHAYARVNTNNENTHERLDQTQELSRVKKENTPENPCAEFIRRHDERASRTRKR